MRLAIISGGSKGLGFELCRHYLAEGFQVIEFSRSAPHAFSVAADFRDPEAAETVVAATLAVLPDGPWEEIVVIANAAMIEPIGPAARLRPQDMRATLAASFVSPVLYLRAALARFQATPCPKRLLNITSGAALRGQAGLSLYCGAKAGLENFIRAVALEQAAEPWPFVAVNVDPGAMDTPMQASLTGASVDDFPDVARFIERQRNGTLRVPARVAAATARIAALPGLEGGSRHNVADHGGG